MKPSVERFTGFADVYDQVRPSPPEAIADLLRQLAKLEMAGLVVDLGCGSGLSMAMWVGKTRSIIGVEPSDDMRREAERRCSTLFPPGAVEWISTEADATQIAGQSVDMAKESTFHKIEFGTVGRLVGLAKSQGGVAALLKAGVSEEEAGLIELRETAQRLLGDRPFPWFWSYRVRIGVK